MKLTVIVGLPGSGKTHLGKELEAQGALLIDDISINGGLDRLSKVVGHPHIVITDPNLCISQDKQAAERMLPNICPGYEIEWIFFQNDSKACLNNILHRQNKGDYRQVKNFVRMLATMYNPPANARAVHFTA